MRLAYVTPRYGREVIGGAEAGARMLAEQLVGSRGWPVEVFTTAALDHNTWADHYRVGDETIDGVVVHRFATASGRAPQFQALSRRVLAAPWAATDTQAEQWVDLQGPRCPELIDAVAASDADVIAFYPYLYYPTVRAIAPLAGRSIMHPAAHDEAPLHMPVFDRVFASAAGFAFQTHSERALVQRRFQVAHRPWVVVGLGVNPGHRRSGRHGAGSAVLGLGDRPYLCCLGRVDDLKGSALLAELFAAYKARRPGPLALAMVGPVSVAPRAHPDIILTGAVNEEDKWEILADALALVSPSPFESFAIVLMEAWNETIPVLANAFCPPTREHCEASGGGLWFGSYAEFEVVVDRLVADPGLRATLGERGRAYVEANFRWPVIVERYGGFLEAMAERFTRSPASLRG